MSELSKALDLILKDHVTPSLKPAGFKKTGRKYKRIIDGHAHSVTLESSSWNRGNKGHFTLNLSVVRPDILLNSKQENFELTKAKGFESGIMHRLSNDESGRFSFSTDAEKNKSLGENLAKLIDSEAFAWFQGTKKDETLINLLKKENSMFALEALSILYMRMGNGHKCNETLNTIVIRRPDLLERTKNWAAERELMFKYDV